MRVGLLRLLGVGFACRFRDDVVCRVGGGLLPSDETATPWSRFAGWLFRSEWILVVEHSRAGWSDQNRTRCKQAIMARGGRDAH